MSLLWRSVRCKVNGAASLCTGWGLGGHCRVFRVSLTLYVLVGGCCCHVWFNFVRKDLPGPLLGVHCTPCILQVNTTHLVALVLFSLMDTWSLPFSPVPSRCYVTYLSLCTAKLLESARRARAWLSSLSFPLPSKQPPSSRSPQRMPCVRTQEQTWPHSHGPCPARLVHPAAEASTSEIALLLHALLLDLRGTAASCFASRPSRPSPPSAPTLGMTLKCRRSSNHCFWTICHRSRFHEQLHRLAHRSRGGKSTACLSVRGHLGLSRLVPLPGLLLTVCFALELPVLCFFIRPLLSS